MEWNEKIDIPQISRIYAEKVSANQRNLRETRKRKSPVDCADARRTKKRKQKNIDLRISAKSAGQQKTKIT